MLHEGRASRLTGSPIAPQEGDPTEPMRDVIYKVDFRSGQPDFCGIAMVRNDVFKRFNQDGLAHAQVSMQVVEVGKHVYFFGPDTIWSCDVLRYHRCGSNCRRSHG